MDLKKEDVNRVFMSDELKGRLDSTVSALTHLLIKHGNENLIFDVSSITKKRDSFIIDAKGKMPSVDLFHATKIDIELSFGQEKYLKGIFNLNELTVEHIYDFNNSGNDCQLCFILTQSTT